MRVGDIVKVKAVVLEIDVSRYDPVRTCQWHDPNSVELVEAVFRPGDRVTIGCPEPGGRVGRVVSVDDNRERAWVTFHDGVDVVVNTTDLVRNGS